MEKFLRPSRAQLKLWGKLDSPKARREAGLFIAEGFKVTEEILKSSWKTLAVLLMEEKMDRWRRFLESLPERLAVYVLTGKEWSKLSQDKEPEGIMALAAMPGRLDNLVDTAAINRASARDEHLLLIYEIANPGNLGAVLRTAHWFGIRTVILSSGSVDFVNPKVVRSSMGSLFHLSLVSDVDFDLVLPAVKARHVVVAGDVRGGVAPHPCRRGTAMLLGSESHGLPSRLLEMADERWRIGGFGGADSLSLPQAAAIMMYECTRKAAMHGNNGRQT